MAVIESRCVVPVETEIAFAVPVADDPGSTLAVWRYNFARRPRWLAPLAERIGALLLQHDMDRRIRGFARGCSDPLVLGAVRSSPT